MHFVPPIQHFALAASTGPRSIERGVLLNRADIGSGIQASTGPRSIERGVPARQRKGAYSLKSLQRGRAQLSAECLSFPLAPLPLIDASTGPRSIERGVLIQPVAQPSRVNGFNGAALN